MGLFLSFFAGICTILGFLIIFIRPKKVEQIICKALSLSSGVMLGISLIDLLPNAFSKLSLKYNSLFTLLIIILFLLAGIIVSYFMDTLIGEKEGLLSNDLYRGGLLTFFVIILHNVPEGIITYLTTEKELLLGIKLSIAIALHNIPEGISIAVPIFYSTGSKIKSFTYTLISGMSEFFGALICMLLFKDKMIISLLGPLYAFIVGIMLSLVFKNLIPQAVKYSKIETIFYTIIGIFVMMIVNLII